jgi:hypothetical protein
LIGGSWKRFMLWFQVVSGGVWCRLAAFCILFNEQVDDRVVRLDMVAPPFGTILRDRQLVH